MKSLIASTAAVVTLLTAGAAFAQDRAIAFGDLDLASPEGAARFDRRVERAARAACGGRSPLTTAACISRFRDAAEELLPAVRRDEYARGRASRELAMIPVHYG
ncbi:UrcA family protein [Brevundimonas bacteroides]|uniref:UrcA family protein n=1 Tax=Brevundimonas bacteroides TaxID=74311 RepID=UPI00138DF215|nr:UrcA family protein [Brevundimonas bacteroides]